MLFCLPAELSHNLTLNSLRYIPNQALALLADNKLIDRPRNVMGLNFPNAVGLAAGLDKNADHYNSLGMLGFGFVEVGSVTPKAQPGNDKPRLFRLTKEKAILNRMGFNNKGVEHLVAQVKRRKFKGILGINIGKNLSTPLDRAHEDYQLCLQQVYPHADYITVNISSPNTAGLRDLQHGDQLELLLAKLSDTRSQLAQQHGRQVPLAVKIAPDMSTDDLDSFCTLAVKHHVDGIIAGNTTSSRVEIEGSPHVNEAGGLSGEPLTLGARRTIAHLAQRLHGEIPIIGCGGISCGQDAIEHLRAGAELVQIYTGLIYTGPSLISDLRHKINLDEQQHG